MYNSDDHTIIVLILPFNDTATIDLIVALIY